MAKDDPNNPDRAAFVLALRELVDRFTPTVERRFIASIMESEARIQRSVGSDEE